ncbi:hypothetical protein EJ08DRAFT_700468 [Tothia fuscella]|uniref:Uncharacterized protein n=1 Tax=Tothia fuscella TaxID=1048955 RepID=A0A9P4NKW9_9PEZI|nr:hypothetical protein EJ08DRAFT_700468 [Tothia fuscella]
MATNPIPTPQPPNPPPSLTKPINTTSSTASRTIPPPPPQPRPNPQTSEPPEWTESQYITSLATLETLQTRINALRSAIPSLMHLLGSPPSTPEVLFKEFIRRTEGPSRGIVALKEELEREDVRRIVERGGWGMQRKGGVREGAMGLCKPVERFEWVDRVGEEGKKGVKRKIGEVEGVNENGKVEGDEEMEGRLRGYAEKFEQVKAAEWDKETQIIKIKVQTPIGKASFTIKRKIVRDKAVYDLKGPACKEENRGLFVLYNAIGRCLESRPQTGNLDYILDMIAAYKDLREAKCDKCKELLDDFAMTPAARRSKMVKSKGKGDQTVWVALHESCLPKG